MIEALPSPSPSPLPSSADAPYSAPASTDASSGAEVSSSAPPRQGKPKAKRPPGRPRRADAPVVPWDEVDRLLVFGQVTTDADTGRETVRHPSLKELAARYGVSPNRMWQYAHRARCYERREESRIATRERTTEMVIERAAQAQAIATTDVVRIVDQFLLGFGKELEQGRVKTDSAADFDRLTRLRELLVGNVDSRQELQGGLTLAAIQARHRQQRDQLERLTPQLTGIDASSSTEAGAALTKAGPDEEPGNGDGDGEEHG